MRTLTQVWFIFISLNLIIMLASFQLLGRTGLMLALATVLIFLYAALQKSLTFLFQPLGSKPLTGNDTTGLLKLIHDTKSEFGLKHIDVQLTDLHTPPLVWKTDSLSGCIILNQDLLTQLTPQEVKLLNIFLLSHLQCRSFVLPQFLSTSSWSTAVISYIPRFFSLLLNKMFQKSAEIFEADLKFLTKAGVSKFEVGYFLNRLHQLNCHARSKNNYFFYCSTLSFQKNLMNIEYGLPFLHVRLLRLMGFSI